MMPKGDTIAEIMRINRSARADFLSEFSSNDLAQYLERLSASQPPVRPQTKSVSSSPGAAAVQAAARITQKDAPFRFVVDASRV